MTVQLQIDGMTCLDCSKHVMSALRRVEGVEGADVDYRTGRGSIALSHPVPTAELIAAVGRAGYRAEVAAANGSDGAAGAAATEQAGGAPPVARARRQPSAALPAPGREPGYDGGGVITAPSDATPATPGASASGTPSFAGEPPADGAAPGRADGDYDLLVIGTGGAGVAAAIQAASMGAWIAIAEGGLVGGTCVNVGCIPSKNLIEAAAHYHAARRGFPGVGPCEPALDWTAVLRQKHDLVADLRQAKYLDVLASYPTVTLLEGRVRLVGGGNGAGPILARVGDAPEARDVRATKVVVATGTAPALPRVPGLDRVDPLDSTTVMELEALPQSLLVLGGGPVGVEAAQTFARFGVRVVLVQRGPRLLSAEDPAVSDALRAALEAEGVEIHTGMTATRAERDGGDVVLHVRQGSLEGQLRAERVLVGAGRRPSTRDMGLEGAGVRLTEKGYVDVDATMRSTTHADVYAAGDVTGGPGYVYVAAAGGRVAAENAVNALSGGGLHGAGLEPREFDLAVVPNVYFTDPQVASVGLTEARAREAGYNVDVSTLELSQLPRALVSYRTVGLVKMVAEAGTGRLLGVHAVAPNAGDFIGEAALAVRFGLTARDLSGTLHPYLTWGEALKLSAQGFTSDVKKLSCCA